MAEAIDDDTKVMLQGQVKKGKVRKFILICKGAVVQSLIVFKKGPYGPNMVKAKKEGFHGQAYCGLITGKGVNLTLQLPGTPEVSDLMHTGGNTYNEEPCKVAKLRSFLAEEGGLKLKPEFAIICLAEDVVGINQEEQADSVSQTPNVANEDGASPATKPGGDELARFTERVKGLMPQMRQAVQTGSEPGTEVKLRASEAQAFARENDFNQAHAKVDQVEALLKQLQSDTSAAADLMALWKERSEMLALNLKKIKDSSVDLGKFPNLLKFAKAAHEFAKKAEYVKAHKVMNEVETLVAQALSSARAKEAQSTGAKGFVRKQVYLQERWRQVPFEVDGKVNALRPRIGNDLTAAVNEQLRKLIAEIDRGIQASVDVGGHDFGPAIEEIEKAEKQVQNDALIKHLNQHPILSEIDIRSTFLAALKDLKEQLAS